MFVDNNDRRAMYLLFFLFFILISYLNDDGVNGDISHTSYRTCVCMYTYRF
jgi:hypothetical protein